MSQCNPPDYTPPPLVQDLPRGRFRGAHNLPSYILGGGYIFRLRDIYANFTLLA